MYLLVFFCFHSSHSSCKPRVNDILTFLLNVVNREACTIDIIHGTGLESGGSVYNIYACTLYYLVAVQACHHETTRHTKAYLIQTRSTDGNKLYIK